MILVFSLFRDEARAEKNNLLFFYSLFWWPVHFGWLFVIGLYKADILQFF